METDHLRMSTSAADTTYSHVADTDSRWKPLVQGGDASQLLSVVRAIGSHLAAVAYEGDDGTVANGTAGIALFFGYLSQVDHERRDEWSTWTVHFLQQALASPFPVERRDSLLNGLAGVGWVADHLHLSVGRFVPVDVVTELLTSAEESPWRGVYDAADGLAGYGLLALERPDVSAYRTLAERVVARLEETALSSRVGVTWWSAPHNMDEERRHRYPTGYFNLGVAHGIPSIIVFLARACAQDISARTAKPLLDKAVRWLLAQGHPASEGGRFAEFVPVGAKAQAPTRSRVAWCYGDLGISAALLAAAIAIDDSPLAQEAVDIARPVARRPFETSGVTETCMCHGTAGNAHLFNRLYQSTGDVIFRSAALEWLRRTLSFHRHDDPYNGFGSADLTRAVRHSTGLFGGCSGVGLALLSCIAGIDPKWDRLMSIST